MKPFQEEGIFKQASPWLVTARNQLQDFSLPILSEHNRNGFNFTVKNSDDTLWIIVHWPKGGGVAFRVAYCPGGKLALSERKNDKHTIYLALNSNLGYFKTRIDYVLTRPKRADNIELKIRPHMQPI